MYGEKYRLKPQFVERVKWKLKDPVIKKRLKEMLAGTTKADLQNRTIIKRLLKQVTKLLREPLTQQQEEQVIQFIMAQKIDPNNTLQLLKLWAMFL